MKKLILIISSLFFFSSSTELHEFFRLPLLLEHYGQHRAGEPDISFLDFLKIHYTGNHPSDNDDNDDNELPFKSKADITHIDSPVPLRRTADEKPVFFLNRVFITRYAEGLPDTKCFSIFHPPRLA